jgi:Fe-S oxidoreductase
VEITLFIPCFIDALVPSVGISMVRIFEKLGHRVDFDESIVCCGQPAFNTGCWKEARDVAVRVVDKLKKCRSGRDTFRIVWRNDSHFLPGAFKRPLLP